MGRQYLNVGSVLKTNGATKKGDPLYEFLLDNNALAQLIELINEHGKEFLGGLTEEQITAGQKLKYADPNRVPRIKMTMMAPQSDNAPDFVKYNVSICVDQPNNKKFEK